MRSSRKVGRRTEASLEDRRLVRPTQPRTARLRRRIPLAGRLSRGAGVQRVFWMPRRGQTGTRLIGPCTGPLTRPPILPSLSLGLSAQPRRPLRSTRSSSSRPRPRAAGRLGGPSPEQRPSALCLVLFLLRNQGRARCSIASVFRVMVGLWFVRRGLRLHLFREMVGPWFALRGRRLQVTHGGMLLQNRSLVAREPGKPGLLRALDRQ